MDNKLRLRKQVWSGILVCTAALSVFASGCGDDDETLTTNAGPDPVALGAINFDCGGEDGQQQQQSKQVNFQQQQSCSQPNNPQQQQQIQFQQSKVQDFDIELDCDSRQVVVENKGSDQERQVLPIQQDGKVQGQMRFKDKVQDDGQGNQLCWIEFVVSFDGQASCSSNQSNSDASPTPTADDKLSLTTTVDFASTTLASLEAEGLDDTDGAGSPGSTPTPSPTSTFSPIPLPTATFSPSPTPTATTSPTPSPTSTFSPSPTPTVTVTPVKVCMVQDPCPIEGKMDLSCSE